MNWRRSVLRDQADVNMSGLTTVSASWLLEELRGVKWPEIKLWNKSGYLETANDVKEDGNMAWGHDWMTLRNCHCATTALVAWLTTEMSYNVPIRSYNTHHINNKESRSKQLISQTLSPLIRTKIVSSLQKTLKLLFTARALVPLATTLTSNQYGRSQFT